VAAPSDEEIREAKEAFLNYLEGEVDKITVAEVVIAEENQRHR
jgi:hypothetical protein